MSTYGLQGVLPWSQARHVAATAAHPLPATLARLDEAVGSLLARDLVTVMDDPPADAAAHDGYAVCGEGPWRVDELDALTPGWAAPVTRRMPLPRHTDAVLTRSFAHVENLADGSVRVIALDPLNGVPDESVRPDLGAGILREASISRVGHTLIAADSPVTPAVVSLAAARGLDGIEIVRPPVVGTLVLGSSLLDHGLPRHGRVRDALGDAVAIITHANPCGIAVGIDIAEAYRKAFDTDPVSAFGGVVAANREVTREMAEAMADVFTEVVVAPAYEPGALEVFAAKKNLRVLQVEGPHMGRRMEVRTISGGVLVQSVDTVEADGDDPASWTLVSGEPADAATLRDLEFAWRACRSVKSNAILLARDGAAVGVGMGQVNRVDSARLSVERAGDRASGAVAASDAFFPFPDGLEVLTAAGVRAIVQPGGSVRDEEVIAAARAAGATMYLTGTRHFFH